MSTLLKWAQNTQGKLTSVGKSSTNSSSSHGERKWIHSPETLQKGHIAYLVKFLGTIVVEEAKGIEVVKEAIRKLRFTQQLRKSETGAKTKKVELTISVDGVAIQEPRTHTILHQFPLHQISYCADDKGEKRFFSFIAKQQNPENESEDKHSCFVFISDKLAEEITLTIGQAFELAYKRFLESSRKDLEAHQKAILIQQKVKKMEHELSVYKQMLLELSKVPSVRSEIEAYVKKNNLNNVLEIGAEVKNGDANKSPMETPNIIDLNGIDVVPPVPPRAVVDNTPAVGTKLEGLLLNEFDHNEDDDDFNPRSFENNNVTGQNNTNLPLIAPPPKPAKRTNLALNTNADLINAQPLSVTTPAAITPGSLTSSNFDPFEMGDFGASMTTSQDIENAIGLLDKRIMEMKAGFTRGISFGNDDFSLDDLDPLKN